MASAQPKRPNTLTPARRFAVRLALATGATLSTLFGAQSLAWLEKTSSTNEAASVVVSTSMPPTPTESTNRVVVTVPSTLAPAAPQIVIVRNPNASVATQPTQAPAAIKPPSPVVASQPPAAQPAAPGPAIVAPAPVQPAPVTRSSRR